MLWLVGMSAQLSTRSPRGCLTCKQRRKKCDETRPTCQRCKHGKFKCLGYTHLDSVHSSSKTWGSKSKNIPDTPLFSYAPIRLPSSDAQGLPPSAKASPRPITPTSRPQSSMSRSFEPPEQRPQSVIPSRPPAQQPFESIPRILRLESEDVHKAVRLVLSQHGLGRKNYLDLIRRLHRQVVSDSPLALNSDITTRLGASLDLALYATMVSNSATGYSIFKESTPLWYRFAAHFPLIRSSNSTVSLAYAISVPRFELSKFIFLDIIYTLALGVPSILPYDTTYRSIDTRRVVLEWVYGCPLPFVILLAKINDSRGTRTHPNSSDWKQVEKHLKEWSSKSTYVDKDSRMTVARLAIQESWRQAGMCGVDSADPRVEASVRQIVRLSRTIEDTNSVGLHLFVPCLIAGAAARAERHRATLRTRIHACREASSWILRGADFTPVLDHLWHGVASGGRPVKWEDYIHSRCATFTIGR
ncbi:unnamed protein product [Rhizoctonia solani]|uniref:Zn(2)-C6 fungal-type domain-containing protein n=1 Tax=Rhizoctonia solani TaxID=456999 RepID=A0A8H3D4F5_9AGAM|nr:unnamed protein product [Rhizoctonia solani]